MSRTLDHYDSTAERYAKVNHELAAPLAAAQAFIDRLSVQQPPGHVIRVLDAGSGTGRDTQAFLRAGFEVDAFDGSPAMAALSSRLTGQSTKVMRFEDMALPTAHYDGVWAMASLLHVARADLPAVIDRLGKSLRPGGLLFASFKHGHTDRIDPRDGRAFTDLDAFAVSQIIDLVGGFELVSTDVSAPGASQTNQEPWFSCLLQRTLPVPTRRTAPRP